MSRRYSFLSLMLVALLALSACNGAPEIVADYPEQSDDGGPRDGSSILDNFRNARGALDFNFSRNKDEGAATLGVNVALWQASLDTLGFLPLASADPQGGVIITDWYEDPQTPDSRFKVNVLILGQDLRADNLRVSMFREKRDGDSWRSEAPSNGLARQLENIILTRARDFNLRRAN